MAHWVETPGHAWLVPSAEENARVPAEFRMPDYEEDCAWSIAVVALPTLLDGPAFRHLDTSAKRAAVLERAREICRNYYPEAFAAITGEQPTTENSTVLAERKFHTDHANDWVVISAVGDWHAGVPQGFVLGTATLGGSAASQENGNPGMAVAHLSHSHGPDQGRCATTHLRRGSGIEKQDYLIPQSRYAARGRFGYVIQPDDIRCDG